MDIKDQYSIWLKINNQPTVKAEDGESQQNKRIPLRMETMYLDKQMLSPKTETANKVIDEEDIIINSEKNEQEELMNEQRDRNGPPPARDSQ